MSAAKSLHVHIKNPREPELPPARIHKTAPTGKKYSEPRVIAENNHQRIALTAQSPAI